jgi:DNA-binding response OmpR family regulator
MIKVLLVEDDVRLADALAGALEARGYVVDQVRTGQAALTAAPVDIILLDLGLPDMDGVDLCRRLRERADGGDTGVIMVTARGRQSERVRGLRSGADDYVVKPLAVDELCARMEAVLRRTRRRSEDPPLTVGPLRVELGTRTVTRDGAPVDLTRKEFDLLAALAREAGSVVSREHLLLRVWHTSWPGTLRTLEVHIGTLRSKLDVPGLIETVRGVGYRLAVPDVADAGPPPVSAVPAAPAAPVATAPVRSARRP